MMNSMDQGQEHPFIRGRGTAQNIKNRFEVIDREPVCEEGDPAICDPQPTTQFITDHAKTIISKNDSPDVAFNAGINPYRGCEHGCVYCYARPTHEYLGFSSGLDFETKIMVKEKAPELLREALSKPGWTPQILAMSGITDCYQPVERRLKLTRRCLEVLAEFRNPVVIITKNFLVTRDIDLLSALARYQAVAVYISITTLDKKLCAMMEPRTSRPEKRLAAVSILAAAGIQVGVNIAPVIPGLTDEEVPRIVSRAAAAGAQFMGITPLRLPYAIKHLFEAWLATHRPDRKEKVLNRIRAIREGKLNDAHFGTRMEGTGLFADQMHRLFELSCKRAGIVSDGPTLSIAHFRRRRETQLTLF